MASRGSLIQAGLHLTHELQTTPERIAALQALPNRLGPLIGQLLGFFASTYVARHRGFVGAPVHDACAVLALTRGMTVVDLRTLKDKPAPNAEVLMSVDAAAGFRIIHDAIASFA